MALPVIGQFIYLIVPEGSYKGRYESNIYDIDEKRVFIDLPVNTSTFTPIELPKGTRIQVNYSDAVNVPCSFETVVEKNSSGRTDLQAIKRPEPKIIKRNQRREYVRVPAAFDVEMTVKSRTLHCNMRDISGGGMSVFVSKEDLLPPGEVASLNFHLKINGEHFAVKALASIIRVQEIDAPLNKMNSCSLKFIDIKENDRQRIIQYVFQYQIRLKERGIAEK